MSGLRPETEESQIDLSIFEPLPPPAAEKATMRGIESCMVCHSCGRGYGAQCTASSEITSAVYNFLTMVTPTSRCECATCGEGRYEHQHMFTFCQIYRSCQGISLGREMIYKRAGTSPVFRGILALDFNLCVGYWA